MEKRRHGQRESRHARSKQYDQDENDHQNSLCNREIMATSVTQGKKRNIIRDEVKLHPRPTVSGMLRQDDFVQKWLAQTTYEGHLPPNATLDSRKENVSCSVGPERLSRGLDFEQFLHIGGVDSNKERANAWHKPRKRILESFSDYSFLGRAFDSDPRPETDDTDNMVEMMEVNKISKTRRQRRKLERSISSQGSVVSLSINSRVKSFEKRRRHKTREDRYEPKRALVDPKPQLNRPKKGEKKKKIKSRKISRNGEDLMHQFSSNNVGLDRLTMRQFHTVGLFKNGRASSPRRRYGLPDLAFSEMGFLRRSKQRPPEIEEGNSLSKSREKERRRSERAQNEISEYFKPSRMLHVEVEQADPQQTGCTSSADHKLRHRIPKDRDRPSHPKSTSYSVDLSTEPVLGLDQRHAFEQLAARSHSRGQLVQRGEAPDTSRNLSDKFTSYCTWSDSVRSPKVSQSKRYICSEVSTTPGSIRRMLNDTGIFTYTGINRRTSRPYERASNEPVEFKLHTKPRRLSRISQDVSPTTHVRKSSHTSIQSRCPIEAVGKIISRNRGTHQEVHMRNLDESVNRHREGRKVLCPAKAIVQHYSPESAWQKHVADGEAEMHPHLSKEMVLQQGLSRQAIAQRAYVKQASTTIAIVPGTDNTNNSTLSADVHEAGMMSHQQHTEQLMHKKKISETADHSPSLGSGEKRGGVICSTETDGAKSLTASNINHGDSIQASKAAISDSLSEHQLDTTLVPAKLSAPYRALETVPDLPISYQRVNGGLDQTGGTAFEGHAHSAVHGHAFEGLPVRGSWPNRASGQIPASHAVFTPVAVEPLYNYQLENTISHELADKNYEEVDQTSQPLYRINTTLMEFSPDNEGELSDRFEGEYELLNSTANLQEYDVMLSSELGSGAYEVQEGEEEHTSWELCHQDRILQLATQQHYEYAQSAGSINQQQSPVMDANAVRGGRHHHFSRAPSQEFAQAEEAGIHHEMNWFWQPRRQY